MDDDSVAFEPLSELDHPYEKVAEDAYQQRIVADALGIPIIVYFKWTCEKCRTRNTFDVPNKLFMEGICGDCGHVTNIRRRGCGYLIIHTSKTGDLDE
jgi:hypothetical protein